MKKLFVIATLVGFGFCANAQTPTTTAPAQTPAKHETAAPAKKESPKMVSTSTQATPAKHVTAKHASAKHTAEKKDATAPTTAPAEKK